MKGENENNSEADISFTIEIPKVKNTTPLVKQCAKSVLTDVTNCWNSLYDTPFTKVLTQIPETNLRGKQAEAERKANIRKIHRTFKTKLQESWEKDDRDLFTHLGIRESKASYEANRSSMFSKFKKDAVKRTGQSKVMLVLFLLSKSVFML